MAGMTSVMHRRTVRIAVVDDHRMVLDGITAHIRASRSDIDIVIAEPSWLALVSHPEFPVDVVVLDLNLNDSISVVTKVKALNAAGSKTVIMSRHADAASIHGALAAGALAFVPKSDSADELITAIHAVAGGARHLSPTASGSLGSVATVRDPGLGRQEQRAMVLYASGRSIKEVAEEMQTTEETVKSYIKRARRKYRTIGVDVGTKILLRRRGIHEGWLSPE